MAEVMCTHCVGVIDELDTTCVHCGEAVVLTRCKFIKPDIGCAECPHVIQGDKKKADYKPICYIEVNND